MATILFGTLFLMLILNIPISISLGIAVLMVLFTGDTNTSYVVIAQRMFTAVDSFPVVAVPFFILAGELMQKGGISDRLIKFAGTFMRKLPASLSIITTAASAFFAAISGSNPATVAAIGGLMYPEMVEAGYPEDKAAAIAAASGTLGVIIPPSIPMVYYSIVASVSVGTMFMAGFIPGLLLAIVIVAINIITCKNYEDRSEIKDVSFFKAFIDALAALIMPFIILGGIYGGVFTPTEASSVACVYAFVISMFVYKELKWSDLGEIFTKTAKSTSLTMFVIAMCAPFSWLMTSTGITSQVTTTILGLFHTRAAILIMLNILLLILGCFLETLSIIVLLTPMLLPIAEFVGLHPIALGLIMVINTSIGMITPPFAVNLFVASSIGGVSIEAISKRILPYLAAEIIILFILTFLPEVILILPRALGMI